jgi:hypothetical protein
LVMVTNLDAGRVEAGGMRLLGDGVWPAAEDRGYVRVVELVAAAQHPGSPSASASRGAETCAATSEKAAAQSG